VVGYVFVGIVLWVESVMIKKGKFKEEPGVLLVDARDTYSHTGI